MGTLAVAGAAPIGGAPRQRDLDLRSLVGAVLAALLAATSFGAVAPAVRSAVSQPERPAPAERDVDTLDDLAAADQASILAQIEAARYHFAEAGPSAFPELGDATLVAGNPSAGIDATLTSELLRVNPTGELDDAVDLVTAGIGRAGDLAPVRATAAPTRTDSTVTIARGPVVEWFRNDQQGFEQGWTVNERPAGAGELVLALEVDGASVSLAAPTEARLLPDGAATPLTYGGLAAFDATGSALPAHFELAPSGLRIVVDDADAAYPVVIDPVIGSGQQLEAVPNATRDFFGRDVALEGRWLAVAAPEDHVTRGGSTNQGSLYVFFDDTGDGAWRLLRQMPHPPIGTSATGVGSLAIGIEPEGVTLVAGHNGASRVVVWTFPGDPDTVAPTQPPSSPQVLVPQAYPGRAVGRYGESVALDGGLLVVGAPNSTTGSIYAPDGTDSNTDPDGFNEQIGLVEVLRRSGGFGTPFAFETRLHPPAGLEETDPEVRDIRQEFGTAVDVEGDVIAVGAIGDDGVQTQTGGTFANPVAPEATTREGAVHVFRTIAGAWTHQGVVTPAARVAASQFGWSVALAGGDLAAGAPGDPGRGGTVSLFDHTHDPDAGTDSYAEVVTVDGDDPTTEFDESSQAGVQFGTSLDFDGTRLVVGAVQQRSSTSLGQRGAAVVFDRSSTGPDGVLTFRQRLLPPSPQEVAVGASVAADGARVAIGAPFTGRDRGIWNGAVLTFVETGGTLQPGPILDPIGHRFDAAIGAKVAQDGDVLVVAAPLDRRANNQPDTAGAVYLFRRIDGAWSLDRLVFSDAGHKLAAGSEWGASLDVWVERDTEGNERSLFIAVGAPGDSDIDLDGRGDTIPNQVVGTAVGTVGVWGHGPMPDDRWSQFATELFAGGHSGPGTSGRLHQYDPDALTPGGRFGTSVAFTADGTLVVGEPGGQSGAGALHRYERTGVGDAGGPSYQHRETLAGDVDHEAFGLALAADGADIAAAGRSESGTARLATFRDGHAATNLAPAAVVDTDLPGAAGLSLDAVDGRIAVGAPAADAARVYRASSDGTSLHLEGSLAGDPGTGFGSAVALSQEGPLSLLVGAPGSDVQATDAGAVLGYGATVDNDGVATWSPATSYQAPRGSLTASAAYGSAIANWPLHGGAVVGAPGHDAPDVDAGRVFVTPGQFVEQTLAPPTVPATGDWFGFPVEVADDLLFVGALGEDPDDSAARVGGVHVFRRVGTTWRWQERVDAPEDGGDQWFGAFLDHADGRLFVGAPFADHPSGTPDAGAVFVLEAGANGFGWAITSRIDPPEPATGDAFGYGLDAEGTHLWVGAVQEDSDAGTVDAGAFHAFERQPSGDWAHVLRVANPYEQFRGGFGSVALDGDTVVLANLRAPADRVGSTTTSSVPFRGELVVHRWDGATWTLEQTIQPPDAVNGTDFGWSIDLAGGVLAVSEQRFDDPQTADARDGRVHLLTDTGSGFTLDRTLTTPLRPDDAIAQFGNAVSLNGLGQLVVLEPPIVGPGGLYAHRYDAATGSLLGTVATPQQYNPATGGNGGLDLGGRGEIALSLQLPADGRAGAAWVWEPLGIAPTPAPPATPFVDVAVAESQVLAGATQLPTAGLAPSLLSNSAQTGGSIAAAPLGAIDLSLAPAGTSVAASPIGSIPIGSIDVDELPADARAALAAVAISSVPIGSIDGGWEALLAGTAFEGVPLQSVSLLDVLSLSSTPIGSIPIGSIDLSSTPIGSIPIGSITLGTTPIGSIPLDPASPLSAVEQWCEALLAAGAAPADFGIACDDPAAPQNDVVSPMSLTLQGAPIGSIPIGSIPIGSIPIGSIPIGIIPIGSIDLVGTPIGSIPIGSIPIGSIPIGSIPIGSIPIGSIPIGSIPIGSIELGGTPIGSIPIGSIALAGSPIGSIPIGSIPIGSIPIGSIPIGSIPIGSIPIGSIPIGSIPIGSIPIGSIPIGSIDLAGSPIGSIPIGSIPIGSIPIGSIPIGSIPIGSIPIGSIPIGSIPIGSITLDQLPLSRILDETRGELRSAPIGSIPIGSIDATERAAIVDCDRFDCERPGATLGEAARAGALRGDAVLGQLASAFAGIRLGDLAGRIEDFPAEELRQAARDGLDGLVLADLTDFDDLTLGELPADHPLFRDTLLGELAAGFAGIRLGDLADRIAKPEGGTYTAQELADALIAALGDDFTLADLTDFDDLTLGELGVYGPTTLAELLAATDPDALADITFGDLLLALLARTQYPWERLDFARLSAQALDGVVSGTQIDVAFQALAFDGARTFRVEVRPPFGSSLVPGSVTLSAPVSAASLKPEVLDGALVWTFRGLAPNALHTLSFSVEPTLQVGTAEVVATVTLAEDDASASDVATITVVEATEPNDTVATATPLPEDTIVLSHVSTSDDLDVYSFDVTEPGSRVALILSNLDADLDAVLYSPRASSTTIQEESPRSIIPVEDESASAIPGATTVGPEAADDLAEPIDLGDLAVNQVSINRGTRDERIDTGPLNRTGTYYLAVSGYNGATNRQPYALRLKRLAPTALPACSARTVPAGTPGSMPALESLPTDLDTLVLVNRGRLEGLHGAADAQAVVDGVDRLVGYVNDPAQDGLGVSAAVLGIDADPQVQAAYAAWDANPCTPDTANAVVAEIVRVVDTYREARPDIDTIVVVGGDDAIPSARVPDRTEIANESGYAQTFSDGNNALFATFGTAHVLTDDAYGDLDPYLFGDRSLFVTDTVVGRLVETPSEIVDQLDDFIAAEGLLDVGTGLVTGYDFLADGANRVADELDETVTGAVDRTLISETWTRQDVEAAVEQLDPDLASINAHFDHFRALPGLGNSTADESDLFTAAAVRAALADDLAGSVVFSMGCHGGLSVSDLLVAEDRALDFAQAVSALGGVFVGNTGYGYGDTEIVALSERLMTLFANRLDGSLSVGQALLYAKAEYAADLTAYGVYDEKALMEATLYGLPFYRLAVADPPAPPPLPPAPAISRDPITGIDTSTIEVTPVIEERTGPAGETYFVSLDPVTGEEQTTAVHDRPVQPRSEETFAAPPGTEAHDALVTFLATTDQTGVDPFIVQPLVDAGEERTDVAADVVFPSSPVRVNPQNVPGGEAYTLAATTGYFRTTATDGSGLQRLVDTMTVQPYFVDDGVLDFSRPTFDSVEAVVADGVLSFAVSVDDDQGGADGVRRVYVLAADDLEPGVVTPWQGIDLVRTPGTNRWSGSVAVSGEEIEYLVQAVDAAGNVGITTNKALNYRDANLPLDPPNTDLDVQVDGARSASGWYTSAVTVTASGGSALTYELVGESDEQPYSGPVILTADGPHTVIVRSADGQRVTSTVRIDTAGPVPIVQAPTNGGVYVQGTQVVQFGCLDAGSGATTCTATLDGEPVEPGGPAAASTGTHTIEVSAGPDVAGNPPASASAASTYTVAGPPVIEDITVPDGVLEPGQPVTVSAVYLAHPVGGPHTAIYSWGDGTTTTCRSDEAPDGCEITAPGADERGTTSATHTFTSVASERTITVTIADRFGNATARSITLNRTSAMTATPAFIRVRRGQDPVVEDGAISATLTSDGQPVIGRRITFHAGGEQICAAYTDLEGVADCTATVRRSVLARNRGYEARFAGDAWYRAITASAPLVRVE